MGCRIIKFLLLLHVLFAALVGLLFWAVITDRLPTMPETPEIEDRWFGTGERTAAAEEDQSVRKFEIEVNDKVSGGTSNMGAVDWD